MSSTVKIDMCLIASAGLLPTNKLHEVFNETLKELNGSIEDGNLFINKNNMGKISLKNRIVVQNSRYSQKFIQEKTKVLRETFTRRAAIAIQDYTYELEQEKKRLIESDLTLAELNARIKENEMLLQNQKKAIERQNMESCEAIVLELKESAENQGYDVVEEKTEEGVQLQFVRRLY